MSITIDLNPSLEKELIEFYESDKWVSISTPSLVDKYRKIARNTLQQKK